MVMFKYTGSEQGPETNAVHQYKETLVITLKGIY